MIAQHFWGLHIGSEIYMVTEGTCSFGHGSLGLAGLVDSQCVAGDVTIPEGGEFESRSSQKLFWDEKHISWSCCQCIMEICLYDMISTPKKVYTC